MTTPTVGPARPKTHSEKGLPPNELSSTRLETFGYLIDLHFGGMCAACETLSPKQGHDRSKQQKNRQKKLCDPTNRI